MKKITSLGGLLVLNAYWVGLSFKWNALHPLVLPAVLLNYVPDAQKNTVLGVLTFVGLMVALVVQPISGAVSDGWRSRWGRRRPLMVLGTLAEYAFLVMIGWGGSLAWLVVGYVGLQFASNIAHGPAQGLLPDRVAPQKLGLASGLKSFMDMASLVVASLAAGRLMNPETRDPGLVLAVVMALLAVSTLITVWFTPEDPTLTRTPKVNTWRNLCEQFRVDFRQNRGYWWMVAQRFFFLVGVYGVQSFLQYYLQDVLRVPNPVQQTGDLLAALTVALIIFSLAGGWLADRYGPKPVLAAAGILATVGFLVLRLAQTPGMLLALGAVLGVGIGLFLTANWALLTRLAPAQEAGKYLGLTNLATAGSAALARLEGPLLDWANAAFPGLWLGYTGLFVLGAVGAVLSVVVLLKVERGAQKLESREN